MAKSKNEVTIGDRVVRLELPASVAIRHEITRSAAENSTRALFAALGACWRGAGRPAAKYASNGYNPLRYGGAVYDELHARDGVDEAELWTAAGAAFALIAKEWIGGDEVDDAVDFTDGDPA